MDRGDTMTTDRPTIEAPTLAGLTRAQQRVIHRLRAFYATCELEEHEADDSGIGIVVHHYYRRADVPNTIFPLGSHWISPRGHVESLR
jgi:hypothetical protein